MIARISLCLTALVATAAIADGACRQPTGKWIVNFADAQCIATRNYGSQDSPVFLVLKAPATGDVLQIGVVRKGGNGDPTQVEGDIVFDNGESVHSTLVEFGDKKLGQRALFANLPSRKLAPIGQANMIRIKARDDGSTRIGTRLATGTTSVDESFSLAQMPAVMSALDVCAADLRNVWKVWDSKLQQTSLKAGPSGDLRSLFSPDDYPAIAMMRNQSGHVAFVLLIDERGKVADCTVVTTSGIAALDAQSCAIVKLRGEFKPAIGLDGNPAKSSIYQEVVWKIVG
jgi:TonB family protein